MNLHALKVFYTVARKGSVTRAAEELLISQPAVTAQIRNLEKETGMVLLAPKGRGIFLTDAGNMLAQQAQRLFSLESEIGSHIEDYKEGKLGTLRIVATYLPANFLLPEWLAEFKKSNEHVEIELSTANSRKALDQLIRYEAEVAVVGGGTDHHHGVDRNVLFEDEMWFVVPKNHYFAAKEVTFAEIMQEPFVLREEGSSTREKLMALCRTYGVNKPKVGLQFNGLNETIRAVMAGYGVIFVSSLEVKEYVARGEVGRAYVKDVDPKNPIAICTRKEDKLSRTAEKFIELIYGKTEGV